MKTRWDAAKAPPSDGVDAAISASDEQTIGPERREFGRGCIGAISASTGIRTIGSERRVRAISASDGVDSGCGGSE